MANKKVGTSFSGGFAGVPRIVMKTSDYAGLSYKAKALLFELAFQYRGKNNGDLTVALSVLRNRGWKREATISVAIKELLAANLIIKSRDGVFENPGSRCSLYAITWQSLDECPGKRLNVRPTTVPLRKFSMEGKALCKTPTTQIDANA
ncbi:MAG: hypothetical protein ACI9BO_001689 [Zhongshania sp.]|jgi:hypothetical protein